MALAQLARIRRIVTALAALLAGAIRAVRRTSARPATPMPARVTRRSSAPRRRRGARSRAGAARHRARRPATPAPGPARSRASQGARPERRQRARGAVHAHRPAHRRRAAAPAPAEDVAAGAALEHCPSCGADFVLPVEWAEAGEHSWWMRLRCAHCDAQREVTVDDALAERFDVALDRGLAAIREALERVERERMSAEIETMIAALRHDLIDASDFGR